MDVGVRAGVALDLTLRHAATTAPPVHTFRELYLFSAVSCASRSLRACTSSLFSLSCYASERFSCLRPASVFFHFFYVDFAKALSPFILTGILSIVRRSTTFYRVKVTAPVSAHKKRMRMYISYASFSLCSCFKITIRASDY